jgi:hypothetical protein
VCGRRGLQVVFAVVWTLAACDGKGAAPTSPAPMPSPGPVATGHTGPVSIVFLEATPPPGSTVTGCGATIAGCRNRVSMRFSLRAQEAGQVLGVRVFLHATNMIACLTASTGPFALARGETREVAVVFDQPDNCGVPTDIANMALVVEGPIEVSSRQTWSLVYAFAP